MPSNVIKRFLYDADAQTLAITFPSGKTYLYFSVPRDVYDAFSQAGSRGAYFNDYIRDRFEFREMDRKARSKLAAVCTLWLGFPPWGIK